MIEGEKEISDGFKAWRKAGMKGWICGLVNGWRDSGQASFHYSWDEYERVGAYGTVCECVCVRGRTHDCVHYAHEFCVPLGLYVGCVCVCVCSGGWALLLWQLPAAKGLEVAPLKWSWSIFVCVILWSYQRWIGWELWESERELDQITENLGSRLTPIPTREERKDRTALQLKGRSSGDV